MKTWFARGYFHFAVLAFARLESQGGRGVLRPTHIPSHVFSGFSCAVSPEIGGELESQGAIPQGITAFPSGKDRETDATTVFAASQSVLFC